ncbi:MAG: hypothetical protein RLZZ324_615 [Candidatus Parcubacteria bacterium]|jgi:UDP-N-acetylglucosamine--N-acetylmuramyl-(pentapeptide) pyrophosphoryl-undecaprenol N-acetylglucosamine transferase
MGAGRGTDRCIETDFSTHMTDSTSPRILFTGGGTLGPVTPLLAVAAEIRAFAPDAELSWIGTRTGPERALVEAAGIPFHAISSGKFRRYFSFANLVDLARVKIGFFQAYALLGRLRPDMVVSAGGFVAVPVAWAARLRGVKVHIHQQDPIPGLANKLSLPCATSVSVALESSLKDFSRRGRVPVWTGNPVRAALLGGSREEAVRIFSLEEGLPTVLVLGGGTGSAALNALVAGALPTLTEHAQIIHVAGARKMVPQDPRRYHQYSLLTDTLPHAFAAADLVVTRAGMGTLTELAALGKPALIVPMPASHQEANARVFASAGAGVLLDERHVTPVQFALTVLGLLQGGARREALSTAMRGMNKPDAARNIARMLIDAAASRKG